MAAPLSYHSVYVVELVTVIYVMRMVSSPVVIAKVKYIAPIVVKVLINTLHTHHTIQYLLLASAVTLKILHLISHIIHLHC